MEKHKKVTNNAPAHKPRVSNKIRLLPQTRYET